MEKKVKSFNEFVNEKKQEVVYPTNFKGMVQSTISSVYTSIMAIAQQFANEKAARNPQRHNGKIEEIDITRAMNLVFHSDWKKKIKEQCLDQAMLKSMERATKQDNVMNKKNQRALGRMNGDDKFNINIDKSQIRFSDEKGSGPGSNQ